VSEARVAVDEVIDAVGRKTIATILELSAQELAGARTAGQSQQRCSLARIADHRSYGYANLSRCKVPALKLTPRKNGDESQFWLIPKKPLSSK